MKRIGIATDSHSSILPEEAERLGIWVLPMPFMIDGVCYYENVTIEREEFLRRLTGGAEVMTSQPSPEEVTALWDRMLEECEQILYLPISSGLSGACSAAMAMAREERYTGRVHVVDHGRVATPLHQTVLDALELVEEGYAAEEIKGILEQSKNQMAIYVGVDTLEYLKKGGRITKAAAVFGTVLHIKPILKLDIGILDLYQKCRGFHKAKKLMIEALKHDFETRFRDYLARGEVRLLAASSTSVEETKEWIQEIKEAFPKMELLCDYLSMGVSCHTGYGALGIGCSCRPERG